MPVPRVRLPWRGGAAPSAADPERQAEPAAADETPSPVSSALPRGFDVGSDAESWSRPFGPRPSAWRRALLPAPPPARLPLAHPHVRQRRPACVPCSGAALVPDGCREPAGGAGAAGLAVAVVVLQQLWRASLRPCLSTCAPASPSGSEGGQPSTEPPRGRQRAPQARADSGHLEGLGATPGQGEGAPQFLAAAQAAQLPCVVAADFVEAAAAAAEGDAGETDAESDGWVEAAEAALAAGCVETGEYVALDAPTSPAAAESWVVL